MSKIYNQIEEIKCYIPKAEIVNKQVSESSVAWQLDHSLKVVKAIGNALKQSNPEKYKAKFSPLKSMIFFTGTIPRGKAKAPKLVDNQNTITKTELEQQVKEVEVLLDEIQSLPENSYFNHHMFGHLNLKKAIQFMGIHTNHHLKIVKDILK